MKIFLLSMLIFLLAFNVCLAADDYFTKSDKVFYDDSLGIVEIFIEPALLDSIMSHVESNDLYPADFVYTNQYLHADTVKNIGFRLRGTSSRYANKKSFKVDFNEFVSGQKFYGLEKINLKSVFTDPSVIRAKLYSDIALAYHLPCFRANHVKLFINNEYRGLYINVEHIDENFIKAHFGNNNGNLYKCSKNANLVYLGNDQTAYEDLVNEYDQPVYELKSNTGNSDYSDLIHFIDIINNTPDSLIRAETEKVLNIPSYYQNMAVDVMTANWDNYWYYTNNYYLYHNTATDKFEWIPYDSDETFGMWWVDRDFALQNIYRWGINYKRPLAARLKDIDDYDTMFSIFIAQLADEICPLDSIETKIDALYEMISPALQSDPYYGREPNPEFQYTFEDFQLSYESSPDSFPHIHYGLKPFFDIRCSSALSQLRVRDSTPLIMETMHFPQYPSITSEISVSTLLYDNGYIKSAELYYDQGEGFLVKNMLKSEPGRKGNFSYTAIINPVDTDLKIKYYIQVKDDRGIERKDPRNAPEQYHEIMLSHEADSLYINEFLASNDSVIIDENNDFDDWIELYNDNTHPIQLQGYYLTDDLSNPTKWQFPDTSIDAKDFLLIWADGEEDQGLLHTNYKLSAGGEQLGLFSRAHAALDTFTFSEQVTDISFGRVADGAPEWRSFNSPTPGFSNNTSAVAERNYWNMKQEFQLRQNYPNPFNASTDICFHLPNQGHVVIEIFNMMGQRVKKLAEKDMNAGYHSVAWDGTGKTGLTLSNGLYLCRIRTVTEMRVIKMLMLK